MSPTARRLHPIAAAQFAPSRGALAAAAAAAAAAAVARLLLLLLLEAADPRNVAHGPGRLLEQETRRPPSLLLLLLLEATGPLRVWRTAPGRLLEQEETRRPPAVAATVSRSTFRRFLYSTPDLAAVCGAHASFFICHVAPHWALPAAAPTVRAAMVVARGHARRLPVALLPEIAEHHRTPRRWAAAFSAVQYEITRENWGTEGGGKKV